MFCARSRPFVRACCIWIVITPVCVTASAGQRLLYITWATESPKESFDYFVDELKQLNPASVEMSPTMITRNGDFKVIDAANVETRLGLVLGNPKALGVGASYVTIVDAQARSGALVLTILEPGRRFDLLRRRVVGSKKAITTD